MLSKTFVIRINLHMYSAVAYVNQKCYCRGTVRKFFFCFRLQHVAEARTEDALQEAVRELKASHAWTADNSVADWFENKWLPEIKASV